MDIANIQPSLPEKCYTLAEPIFELDTVFERFRPILIHRRPVGEDIVYAHWVSVPIYLPEIGCLISLDATSTGIARDLSEIAFGGRDKNVMILKLYNFDSDRRRAVSWGNYMLKELEEQVYGIYAAALFNDMILTPSGYWKGSIVSPLRYFPLESYGDYSFRCFYSYNTFIAFIDPEKTKVSKKKILWVGRSFRIIPLHAKFIKLLPDGTVKARDIILSFREELLQSLELERGYYICTTESFNRYITNHPDSSDLTGKNVNVVRTFRPLVHSPYDVVPFLFPYFIDPDQMDLLIQFTVPSTSVRRILSRFEKFGGRQDGCLVENYTYLFEKLNGLLRINRYDTMLSLTAVNPSFVTFLVKKSLLGPRKLIYVRRILVRSGLIERIRDFKDGKRRVETLLAAKGSYVFMNARKRNTNLLLRFYDEGSSRKIHRS